MEASNDFLKIAITSPASIPNEAERISRLLSTGEVDFVHIRKPSWTQEEISELIESIPSRFHSRLKLHDYYNLIYDFKVGGIHVNFRNRNLDLPKSIPEISKSAHSISELNDFENYDYIFLSPIFDSISKKDYKSGFNLDELSSIICGKRIIALGGVTPNNFALLKEKGFYGAAMLGHFWN